MSGERFLVILGNIVHCTEQLKIHVIENGFVLVFRNKIVGINDESFLEETKARLNITKHSHWDEIRLKKSQILIPGLVDTHIHAPQYPNSGLGYDKPLLEWLEAYTYKLEKKYKDLDFSKEVFDAVVRKTLDYGTTTACYFASLFPDSSLVLVDSVITHGQRALIGKINMTTLAPGDYLETPSESVINTENFIKDVISKQSDLVQPIITPRFALSVDMELMKILGNIAKENDLHIQLELFKTNPMVSGSKGLTLIVREIQRVDYTMRIISGSRMINYVSNPHKVPVQPTCDWSLIIGVKQHHVQFLSHISENVDEIKMVKEKYDMSYAETYDKANLLTTKTILAHGVYLTDDELKILANRGTSISHCPDSNTCLKSGLCDVRRLQAAGIKVGLGTDVSGGPSASIIQAMKAALDASVHISFQKENYQPLNFENVFYLATLGGAEALAMEDKIGNFEIGKDFDALIIDMDIENSSSDFLLECSASEILQKFIYLGDDRNVINVYVAGRRVK